MYAINDDADGEQSLPKLFRVRVQMACSQNVSILHTCQGEAFPCQAPPLLNGTEIN